MPSPVVAFLTYPATTWDVPADWNDNDNKIECLGCGGASSPASSGAGSGGGAYARKNNVVLTPGTTLTDLAVAHTLVTGVAVNPKTTFRNNAGTIVCEADSGRNS